MCEVAETLIAVVMNGRVSQGIRIERCLTNRQGGTNHGKQQNQN